MDFNFRPATYLVNGRSCQIHVIQPDEVGEVGRLLHRRFVETGDFLVKFDGETMPYGHVFPSASRGNFRIIEDTDQGGENIPRLPGPGQVRIMLMNHDKRWVSIILDKNDVDDASYIGPLIVEMMRRV